MEGRSIKVQLRLIFRKLLNSFTFITFGDIGALRSSFGKVFLLGVLTLLLLTVFGFYLRDFPKEKFSKTKSVSNPGSNYLNYLV